MSALWAWVPVSFQLATKIPALRAFPANLLLHWSNTPQPKTKAPSIRTSNFVLTSYILNSSPYIIYPKSNIQIVNPNRILYIVNRISFSRLLTSYFSRLPTLPPPDSLSSILLIYFSSGRILSLTHLCISRSTHFPICTSANLHILLLNHIFKS